jgi:hypothetical protein
MGDLFSSILLHTAVDIKDFFMMLMASHSQYVFLLDSTSGKFFDD